MQGLDIVSKELINKGWSSDKKYCITTSDGIKYLLRVTPKDKGLRAKELFNLQKEVAELGLPMPRALSFGECDEGFYTIYNWVEGEEAEGLIPHLKESEQYIYGIEAGRILKTIHMIPAPDNQPDWEPRFNKKIDRNIRMYEECPIKFDGAEDIIDYIESNRHLLAYRPQCFQHGDYHIGNMMIEKDKLIIIDFDRYDYGDPWEEFNRIVWSAQASPVFASGIIDGYFDNMAPLEFWKLLALYISSNMLASLSWAITFGEKEIDTMLNQAQDVLNWYDNMKNPIPTWYSGKI